MGRLVLASASPRRRELLSTLGAPFSVRVPDVDESQRPGEPPQDFAERLAREKAEAVAAEPDETVVAADTIVVRAGRILGKPADAAEARAMLSFLSGHLHEVVTAVCIRRGGRAQVFSVSTAVSFRTLGEEEIERYIATGEPMDKAGAYAIQGGAAHMVRSVDGSYTNVVGLPLCELYETLKSF